MQAIRNDEILNYEQNGMNNLDAAVAFSYSGGTGYTSAPTVAFSGGTPETEAEAIAIIENGRVVALEITNQGAGFDSTPTIAFSGGGSNGAAATAIVEDGKVVGATITNSGNDRKLTITDATSYASGDSRKVVNVTVHDKFGNKTEAQIDDSPANVVIDVVEKGLNPADGLDATVTVISAERKIKDGSALDIGKNANSGNFVMEK